MRNSSIELFRIICAISIIILHFFGWFLGGLTPIDSLTNANIIDIFRLVFVSLTIVCVNCFILISGFFGITLKPQKVINLLVTLLLIFVSLYFIDVLLGKKFEWMSFFSNILCVSRGGYFVQCYFVLMFLSPLLNVFVEKYEKNIISFVLFLTILELYTDCIRHIDSMGIQRGYSIFHFCLMYLWGRCVYIHKDRLLQNKKVLWFLSYLFCACIILFMYIFNIPFAFNYSSPFVIAGSISLFAIFLYKSYYIKIINTIASSTFTVFIVNCIDPVKRYLVEIDEVLLSYGNTFFYLSTSFCVIICTFCIAVLYDKLIQLAIKPTSIVLCEYYDKIRQRWI